MAGGQSVRSRGARGEAAAGKGAGPAGGAEAGEGAEGGACGAGAPAGAPGAAAPTAAEKSVVVPCSTPDCERTTFSRTGNPVMCPCCRSRKSRAKRKAERLEGGAAAAPPPRRAAARRGGDPELRFLRQAISQQESALTKMREVLARLEGEGDDPPAAEPAAAAD